MGKTNRDMKKISTEVRFNSRGFDLMQENKGLRLFFSREREDYCIIVDKDDNVLFEIMANCGQNEGFLQIPD